jgi:hypothetical protein
MWCRGVVEQREESPELAVVAEAAAEEIGRGVRRKWLQQNERPLFSFFLLTFCFLNI